MTAPTTTQEYLALGLNTPFDEGPAIYVRQNNAINTGSVDTFNFDAYRQGVSMTMPSHYWGSVVKIHSGEDKHKLFISEYGITKNTFFRPQPFFQEIDYFNSERFIRIQEYITGSEEFADFFTYPIITSDSDQAENHIFNGVIEPLSIRSVISFFSIDSPFEAHDVRGSFGSGNENQKFGVDQVVTVYDNTQGFKNIPYLDVVDTFNVRPTNGYFIYEDKQIPPYDDQKKQRCIRYTTNAPQDIQNALMSCSPDTETYIDVNTNKLSMNAGFTYDVCNQMGTDSIAFGGMLYSERNQISSSFVDVPLIF